MRHIKVFVSSSLKHEEARKKIAAAFAAPDPEITATFSTYVHESEENDKYRIQSSVSSQSMIDAISEEHEVFLLYAGDCVGEMTIREFQKALNDRKWNKKFIYVLHDPDDKIKDRDPKIHYEEWDDFRTKYMHDGNGNVYYEKFTKEKTLEEHIRSIRRGLSYIHLVPFAPFDIIYDRITYQAAYRLSLEYIPRPDIDEKLHELLSFPMGKAPAPLVVVSGMSLSGKTRSVTEAIHILDANKVKVHYLQGRAEKSDLIFNDLNFNEQFYEGWHHVLFIDEFSDLLFDFDDSGTARINKELKNKFFELCEFAAANPERLVVVGTTAEDFSLIKDVIANNFTNTAWVERVANVNIAPMKATDMWLIFRKLQTQNKISAEKSAKIKDGMPIGALFIDLHALTNKYNLAVQVNQSIDSISDAAMDNRYIFDAVKTIWMWKNNSRNDFNLLLDYFRYAYPEEAADYTAEQLRQRLSDLKSFFTLKRIGRGSKYQYLTEQVLVDEVFKFLEGDDSTEAIKRLVHYILRRHPEHKYEELWKHESRTRINKSIKPEPVALREVIKSIGIDTILSAHEESETYGGHNMDWCDLYASTIIAHEAEEKGFDTAYGLFLKRPVDNALATMLELAKSEAEMAKLAPHLYVDGDKSEGLLPRFLTSQSRYLNWRLIITMTFEEAIAFFSALKIDDVIDQSEVVDDSKQDISYKSRNTARNLFAEVLNKVENADEFTAAINCLKEVNDRRAAQGRLSWFDADEEIYFYFIRNKTWKTLSENVIATDIIPIFNLVNGIEITTGESTETQRLNKAYVLNRLMRQMNFIDATHAWNAMGNLRDSFSLMNLLNITEDYTLAITAFERFRHSEFGRTVKIDLKIANAILKSANTREDLLECVNLFKELGFLPTEVDKKRNPNMIWQLFDVNDAFTDGELMDKLVLNVKEKELLLRRHLDLGKIREAANITPIIKSQTFEETDAMLFGPTPDYLTPEEQKLLASHPYTLSLFIRNAKAENKKQLDARLTQALKTAKEQGYLPQILDNTQSNIINEYLGNANFVMTYELALDIIRRLNDFAGFDVTNCMTLHKLIRLHNYSATTYKKKIEFTNSVILSAKGSRSDVMKLLLQRVSRLKPVRIKKPESRIDKMWLDSPTPQPFPCISYTGSWELRTMTLNEWLEHLAHNRYMSIHMFGALLENIAHDISGPARESKIDQFNKWVEYAKLHRLYIQQADMVHIRRICNQANFSVNLVPITHDYLFIKDIYHDGAIMTPQDAFKKLDEYEQKYDSVLRTSTLYARILTLYQRTQEIISPELFKSQMVKYGFTDEAIITHTLNRMVYNVKSKADYLGLIGPLQSLTDVTKLYKNINRAYDQMVNAGLENDAREFMQHMYVDTQGHLAKQHAAASPQYIFPILLTATNMPIENALAYAKANNCTLHNSKLIWERLVSENHSYETEEYAIATTRADDLCIYKQLLNIKISNFDMAQRYAGLLHHAGKIFGPKVSQSAIIITLGKSGLNLPQIVGILKANNVRVSDEKILDYLIGMATQAADLQEIIEMERISFSDNTGVLLLIKINDLKHKRFRADYLDVVYTPDVVTELGAVCKPESKFYYFCKNNFINNISSNNQQKKRFGEFCRDVLKAYEDSIL